MNADSRPVNVPERQRPPAAEQIYLRRLLTQTGYTSAAPLDSIERLKTRLRGRGLLALCRVKGNPFSDAVAEGIGRAALVQIEEQRRQQAWAAHIEACRCIMKNGVLARLDLAAEAARHWGHTASVAGIRETKTHTGILHLRAHLLLDFGNYRFSKIEFIGSPTSGVIGIEGERMSHRRRWPKMAFSAEAISGHGDNAIREFLIWGVL